MHLSRQFILPLVLVGLVLTPLLISKVMDGINTVRLDRSLPLRPFVGETLRYRFIINERTEGSPPPGLFANDGNPFFGSANFFMDLRNNYSQVLEQFKEQDSNS